MTGTQDKVESKRYKVQSDGQQDNNLILLKNTAGNMMRGGTFHDVAGLSIIK